MSQPFAMLSSLLAGIATVHASQDRKITHLSLDSRDVVRANPNENSGTLFVALAGLHQHGGVYAQTAEKNGAVSIICEVDQTCPEMDLSVPHFEVQNLRDHLGQIAGRFYGSPSESLNIIGITGTDGKTSVSHFIAQAVKHCAVMGTIGVGTLDALQKSTHTTPDVLHVHQYLSEMKTVGVETVAMEVSSHALHQGRVADVQFDVAVLTNLSRDHLDYHQTLEAYAEAKKQLFKWNNLKTVLVNLDDAFGREIFAELQHDSDALHGKTHVMGYGIGNMADYPDTSLVAHNARFTRNGIHATVSHAGQQGELAVSVLGRFNLSNLLAAIGSMLALGIKLEQALDLISSVHTVAGRMEKVVDNAANDHLLTVVDYAHTPNALKTVLKALREHMGEQAGNNLICVFGCGGDRDRGKRPLMAAAAERYADVVIVTDDNPRSEDPEKIINDIVAGFKHREQIIIEHDRATAIRQALQQARKGDAVLIAGKGHENVQILASGTVPFSDREQADKVLRELAA